MPYVVAGKVYHYTRNTAVQFIIILQCFWGSICYPRILCYQDHQWCCHFDCWDRSHCSPPYLEHIDILHSSQQLVLWPHSSYPTSQRSHDHMHHFIHNFHLSFYSTMPFSYKLLHVQTIKKILVCEQNNLFIFCNKINNK